MKSIFSRLITYKISINGAIITPYTQKTLLIMKKFFAIDKFDILCNISTTLFPPVYARKSANETAGHLGDTYLHHPRDICGVIRGDEAVDPKAL